MTTPTRTQVANKVHDVATAADAIVGRSIDDIPTDFARADGAREIAVLTLTAMSHDYEFKPVMAALEKLAALKDWSHSFFVAHIGATNRPTFNWRDAPMRKYESFADFYRQELEATFGSWESLQRTWAKVVKKKMTEKQARAEIAARVQAVDREDRASQRPVGTNQHSEGVDTENVGINTRPTGTSVAADLRRLRKDRPDIHARVLAGEISANAGMIEADFRKKRPSQKRSWVEKTMADIDRHTTVEQRQIWLHLQSKFKPQ